ncbi:lysophospholipid acyltransferase family protein [Polymorphobacter fuscus]|uniref:1-acyl-sn-glycerol-3-phosphate acyltransferase n=1 Tax=Sandarakinorhabdus fusca TaxID=1439888 RepID=A0A7C9GQS8_9SPHN|nr:lysophospholipid acyltransferase family protein [Polymorphobacter fuscus]KAB7643892.1 1-acyl-sn-glycerol-3-phosphate acyltransferase [Polymorphobacter fuscus]MQT18595.1 1-acyl-sn-glycerol-3-phosphate acyltransferase [Polymorphobacter fuscus]NJC07037.1 1-acyl-sn-glycerol-3-phosphate acyltransferase [Polymorphobacter fuscus]
MTRSPLATLVALVRSVLFTLAFYLGSLVIVPLVLLTGWLFPRQLLFLGPKLWAGWFYWCARWLGGIRLRVEGTIPQGPHLFAIKHESAYEAIMTLWLFDRPAVVMKAELRAIPVWGAASARHGSIWVDRGGSATMLRAMMKAAQGAVSAGRPVVIFPEGTRVAVGQAPALAAGFAGLYKMLKLPVVPIALDSGTAWPRNFIKYPGVVTLRVGDAIAPGLPRDVIETQVHAAINALQHPDRPIAKVVR